MLEEWSATASDKSVSYEPSTYHYHTSPHIVETVELVGDLGDGSCNDCTVQRNEKN